MSEEVREPFPMQPLALTVTAPPRIPGPLCCLDEPQQATKVAAHSEGVIVALQALPERGVLHLYRLMPMAPTPGVEDLLGPSEARPPCLTPHLPATRTGTHPVAREPYKVEGGWTFTALLARWGTPKGQPPRLVRVQGQSKAPQPFVEHRQPPSCFLLTLEADDEVVTIADQGCLAPQPRLHLCLEPLVEHVVQIDVTQQR